MTSESKWYWYRHNYNVAYPWNSMNTCGRGSFTIHCGTREIDVWTELGKTNHVPCIKHIEGIIDYSSEVQTLIMKFIQLGGYADLTLAEYLDEIYDPTSCRKSL